MERSRGFRSSQRFSKSQNAGENAESIFAQASTSAAKYVSNSSSQNTTRLDESLSEVIRFISDLENVARLSLKNHYIHDLLRYTPIILGASTTNPVTRSRLYRMLFNIAHHNLPIRRFMAAELRLLGSVFSCLKLSLKEQLGPQNMIDILRLMQVLSYEKNVPLEHWANELISFLMGEVVREHEPEWMAYCIAILCNLASASKSACRRIKASTSYKKFNRQLMKLLQHEARIIVVSSLVLIGYLDEKVRDMVYCTENVHDTFVCTFNVLNIGDDDCMMTRQIATDLLRRLVVSESTPQLPTLATTGKNVLNYGFFLGSVQQTAELLASLDPRMEESLKVYDLFLAFCSLQVLRTPVCQAVLRCKPTEARLTTPILAIAETASIRPEEAINIEIPLKALQMLVYLFNEIIEPNDRVVQFVPVAQIVALIDSCIHTPIDLQSEFADQSCRRIQLGLKLAEVCAKDEDCRNELLSVCSANLVNQIVNWQFNRNPVVSYLTLPPKDRTDLKETWTMSGIGIVLDLIRLLAVLKDHSKAHKDQYWQILKDEQLIPFLAYANCFGDHETVKNAFLIYSYCVQVHAFPIHMLAEMIASCKLPTPKPVEEEKQEKGNDSVSEKYNGRYSPIDYDEKSIRALDELLKKVSIEGANLCDVKTSDLFSAYEKKIQLLNTKIRDLESLVKTKDEAIAQTERLRHYPPTAQFVTETEISRIREITRECEDLKEENAKLVEILTMTKRDAEQQAKEANDTVARISNECEALRVELKNSQKTIDSYLLSYEELQRNHERASTQLLHYQTKSEKLEQENGSLVSELQHKTAEYHQNKQIRDAEINKLNTEFAQKIVIIEQFLVENREIKRQFDEKSAECEAIRGQLNDTERLNTLKDNEIMRLRSKISDMEQRLMEKEKETCALAQQNAICEEQLAAKEKECQSIALETTCLREQLAATKTELEKLERLREAMLSLASSKS